MKIRLMKNVIYLIIFVVNIQNPNEVYKNIRLRTSSDKIKLFGKLF